MDRVLSDQAPDTWDSFPLFQILNDYLRADGKLFSMLKMVVTYKSIKYITTLQYTLA